jgi:hypothetical protein
VTITEYVESLNAPAPPAGLSAPLLALWHDGRGDWTAAHEVAQDIHDETGSWIHAYLHRKEGDAANAGYWYRRAGRPVSRESLEAEWRTIATALLTEPR